MVVSYKRLNPEDVQFSHAALSAEPRHAQEDVPDAEDGALIPRRPPCSITTCLVVVGALLLLLCGGWLLGTMFWLHRPAGQRPPRRRPPRSGRAPTIRRPRPAERPAL
ncbi:hypothetical protein EYF80_001747 [Liparis tanakae]|uniref:Uncharacterized protein n=1 Tax=Liparis tanakae TaxID=230148 RepID=A0A4Z2JD53_9TELE|nr:hypothetical protein EYF80_001747 [Liparis tanakae]